MLFVGSGVHDTEVGFNYSRKRRNQLHFFTLHAAAMLTSCGNDLRSIVHKSILFRSQQQLASR